MRAAVRRREPTALVRSGLSFVGSGCYLLDQVLGGGWATGRIANLVGDSAVGKTLIAVEACAQFSQVARRPSDIRYVEAEHAYNEEYAKQIGMPSGIDIVENINTVEDLFNDLDKFCKARQGSRTPSLYAVDSLDALSDKAEMERDISKGSFGASKAAQMSELLRRQVPTINNANVTLLIVSQLRDKIGVMFGERQTRSGGKALQYYCSQVVWLSELRKRDKTIRGIKRIVGTDIRARNKKNKVGPPFREADMTIWFNYGLDDEGSMLDWLDRDKNTNGLDLDEIYKQLHEARRVQDREWVREINVLLREEVAERWSAIEEAIRPPMTKYA